MASAVDHPGRWAAAPRCRPLGRPWRQAGPRAARKRLRLKWEVGRWGHGSPSPYRGGTRGRSGSIPSGRGGAPCPRHSLRRHKALGWALGRLRTSLLRSENLRWTRLRQRLSSPLPCLRRCRPGRPWPAGDYLPGVGAVAVAPGGGTVTLAIPGKAGAPYRVGCGCRAPTGWWSISGPLARRAEEQHLDRRRPGDPGPGRAPVERGDPHRLRPDRAGRRARRQPRRHDGVDRGPTRGAATGAVPYYQLHGCRAHAPRGLPRLPRLPGLFGVPRISCRTPPAARCRPTPGRMRWRALPAVITASICLKPAARLRFDQLPQQLAADAFAHRLVRQVDRSPRR